MSQLTDNVEKHTALYVEAFNAGDFATNEAFSARTPVARIGGQGVLKATPPRPRPGVPREGRRWPCRAAPSPRHPALLIVDWTIDTVDADGKPEHLKGVGVDVLRLGEDKVWRYAIDDPFGEG
ncbi:hypothetical protein SMICM304S_10908 [Streptomyces microflavus]